MAVNGRHEMKHCHAEHLRTLHASASRLDLLGSGLGRHYESIIPQMNWTEREALVSVLVRYRAAFSKAALRANKSGGET